MPQGSILVPLLFSISTLGSIICSHRFVRGRWLITLAVLSSKLLQCLITLSCLSKISLWLRVIFTSVSPRQKILSSQRDLHTTQHQHQLCIFKNCPHKVCQKSLGHYCQELLLHRCGMQISLFIASQRSDHSFLNVKALVTPHLDHCSVLMTGIPAAQ